MKCLYEKNSSNGEEIEVRIDNVKETFSDVFDLIVNPSPDIRSSIKLTETISDRKKSCSSDAEAKVLEEALLAIEETMMRFDIRSDFIKVLDTDDYFPMEFILYRANGIRDIYSLKKSLINDQRTFSCFYSNRVDSLIAIFKLDSALNSITDYLEVLEFYQKSFLEDFDRSFEIIPYGDSVIIPYDPYCYVNYDCTPLSTDMIE